MIVSFWEGRRPPAYMVLCMTSWLNLVDSSSILVLNHKNLNNFIGADIILDQFKMFSFAKQSDIASAMFLNRHGGTFLDVDTVLTQKQPALDFITLRPSSDIFLYMGDEAKDGVHIGALNSPAHGTVVSHWSRQLQEDRVPGWKNDNKWSYVGNDVVERFIKTPEGRARSKCIDVMSNYITPENQLSHLLNLDSSRGSRHLYEEFWFNDHGDAQSERLISLIDERNMGIVCLHNSWTPSWYSGLTVEQIREDKSLLSRYLQRVAKFQSYSVIERKLQHGS